jgi:hypothetical protein
VKEAKTSKQERDIKKAWKYTLEKKVEVKREGF